MIHPITIEKNKTELDRITYTFTFLDTGNGELLLTRWTNETRKTKKHKWIVQSEYNAYERRQSTIRWEDVKISQEILDEAKSLFVNGLFVGLWNKNRK